jgi:hypothetical protein
MNSNYPLFSFVTCPFGVITEKPLLKVTKDLLLHFLLRGFTFRLIVNFELTFMHGMKQGPNVTYLHVNKTMLT